MKYKRYILTEEELEAYEEWVEKKRDYFRYWQLGGEPKDWQSALKIWMVDYPCPLPPMVELPEKKELTSHYTKADLHYTEGWNGYLNKLKTLLGI